MTKKRISIDRKRKKDHEKELANYQKAIKAQTRDALLKAKK